MVVRLRSRNAALGFTLVEAMVVIAIAAVLAGLGSSSFVWLMQSTRIRTAAFDLVADLDYARSEAIKRNAPVLVAPNTANTWESGWTVAVVDGDVLRDHAALGPQLRFTNAPAEVRFNGAGRATLGAVGNFRICPPSGASVNGRNVRVDPSGLSRSSKFSCT